MKTVEPQKPLARNKNLVVKEVAGEVLIYDLEKDKAHCLNQTAALIWKYADGRRDTASIASLLTEELNTTVNEKVVWYALSQLSKDNLLENKFTPQSMAGMNRREVIRALGIAAVVAVPVVTSIVAPTPAQAATCITTGGSCTGSAQCCSGLCNGGFCA